MVCEGARGEGGVVFCAAHPAESAGDSARASPIAGRLARAGGVAASGVDSELSKDAVVGDAEVAALRWTSLSTKRILCNMPCSLRKAARWAGRVSFGVGLSSEGRG